MEHVFFMGIQESIDDNPTWNLQDSLLIITKTGQREKTCTVQGRKSNTSKG